MDTSNSSPRAKLLVVEDDPSVLTSVARLLGKDFEVLAARTAAEALARIDEHPDVAIVLADHRLPDQAGLGLLASVRTKAPDAVRALFSGRVELSEVVAAINTSLLHRFILKPWDNEYFRLQMLEALLIHSQMRERNELERLSVTDSVTQLKNHRYFQDRLLIEVERSTRHHRDLALAMIDIDRFKVVNDTYGHPVGDQFLKALALRILDQVRSIDTVARYGGEEFAVIMPDTIFTDAIMVAERIRKAVEKMKFAFPNTPEFSATISIGVAACPLHASTAQDLLTKADAALYQAKSQGRNQTVGTGESPPIT